MATATDGFRKDGLSVASADSMGVQSKTRVRLLQYRYPHRETSFRVICPQLLSIRQRMHELWENKHRGRTKDDKDQALA